MIHTGIERADGWMPRTPDCGRLGASAATFTLAEMIVVLVIIGILAGSAVVSLRGRQDLSALRATTKDLAMALRFASDEARVRQRSYRVLFLQDLRAYRIETARTAMEFEPLDGPAGRIRHMAEGVRILTVMMDGEAVEPLPQSMEFRPLESGFSGRVQLANKYGRTMAIEVMNASGQVHVSE